MTEQFSAASKGIALLSLFLNSEADVVSELRPGDLVIDDFFTLFEAVGALEVYHNSRASTRARYLC